MKCDVVSLVQTYMPIVDALHIIICGVFLSFTAFLDMIFYSYYILINSLTALCTVDLCYERSQRSRYSTN